MRSMESRNIEQDLGIKSRVQQKIRFLENQLVSLDHYLPETYDYLMQELDIQRRLLAELEVSETFQEIDNEQAVDSEKHLIPNL